MLTASLPEAIELAVEDIPVQAVVFGRSAQLQQVIINLCTNASQAMDGKGLIRLSAEQRNLSVPVPLSHGELTAGSRSAARAASTTARTSSAVRPSGFWQNTATLRCNA